MDLITFAMVVGLFETVAGLAFIVSPVKALARVLEIIENYGLTSIMMFGFLTISVTAIYRSGEYETNLSGFLTLLAIITSVKALFYIWFPSLMVASRRWFLKKDRPTVTRLMGMLMTGFGIFLFTAAYQLLEVG